MRIAITGSRDWTDLDAIQSAILAHNPSFLILGDARGADAMAQAVARSLSIPFKVFHADWKTHRKAAGAIRNSEMIAAKPDLVLAFPLQNSKGTWDCIRKADKAGIPVVIWDENWGNSGTK